MPGRGDTLHMTHDPALASALRALPQAAPEPGLWPELAQALAASRRAPRRRRMAALALAASVAAVALLLPRTSLVEREPATPATAATSPTPAGADDSGVDEIASLHQRSQTLERWIAGVSAHAPQDGRNLMAAVELEDLIGLVDLQLGATRGPADALPLWRQRVALLEDLATVRAQAFAVAARNTDAPGLDGQAALYN
jgi:hypothetical protein